jgi:hypothetical protein
MNISKKIEEIRQKPENIRMRYVWFFVAVSMLIIIIIWIFSLKEAFAPSETSENQPVLPNLQESFQEIQNIKKEAPSIQEMINESSDQTFINEEISDDQTPNKEIPMETQKNPETIDSQVLPIE